MQTDHYYWCLQYYKTHVFYAKLKKKRFNGKKNKENIYQNQIKNIIYKRDAFFL